MSSLAKADVRRLIRDGTLAGFRADGYWIVRGEAVARYGASAEGAVARLRMDYPGWRIGMLSRCFFAITGIGAEGPATVVVAATADGVRRELERWHAARLKMRRTVAPGWFLAGLQLSRSPFNLGLGDPQRAAFSAELGGLGLVTVVVAPGDCRRVRGFPCAQRVPVRPGGAWTAACPCPGLVSLRRYVGSRNRSLAALAPGGQRSFPVAGLVVPASPALALILPAGKHLGRPGRPVCGRLLRSAAT